jgi:DNA-binding IclR family transcriptional regulator
VHRYLVSLCRSGIAEQDPKDGRYDLGRGALKLGLAAQSRLDEFQMADDAVRDLHQATGLAVTVMVWGDSGPIIIRHIAAPHAVIISARVGASVPVIKTSTGRLFAAFLPHNIVSPLIEAEFAAGVLPTAKGRVLDRAAFDKLIAAIRKQRLAFTEGDYVSGFSAISAPVFDRSGTILMTITLLLSAGDPMLDTKSTPVVTLDNSARDLSQRLGYRGN